MKPWLQTKITGAVLTYDNLGGLANDHNARQYAAEALARDTRMAHDRACELLADALARRAANNLNQPKPE